MAVGRAMNLRRLALTRALRRGLGALVPARLKPQLLRWLRNTRYRMNSRIGRSPTWGLALLGLLGDYQERLVGAHTELVIEGAPRVASTYCVTAFQIAQQRQVKVASHLHLPVQILRAVRLGVPALVLIRSPGDAARSSLLRHPELNVEAVLERYYSFYEALEPVREFIVVADFAEVLSDLGAVIERINQRFGTDFKPYVKSPVNQAKVDRLLRERDTRLGADSLRSYRPNATKEARKAAIGFAHQARTLARCEAVYRRLTG